MILVLILSLASSFDFQERTNQKNSEVYSTIDTEYEDVDKAYLVSQLLIIDEVSQAEESI